MFPFACSSLLFFMILLTYNESMNLQAITIQYVAAMVILNMVHLSICVYYLASPKENVNTASTRSGIAMPLCSANTAKEGTQ